MTFCKLEISHLKNFHLITARNFKVCSCNLLRYANYFHMNSHLISKQHVKGCIRLHGDICQRLPPDEAWHKVKSPKAD